MSLVAAAARREDAIPSEAERRGRLLAELTGSTPPQAGVDPTSLVGEPQAGEPEPTPPAAATARQDRLHELVELFTAVVTRIDQRLDRLSTQLAVVAATADATFEEIQPRLPAIQKALDSVKGGVELTLGGQGHHSAELASLARLIRLASGGGGTCAA